MTAQPAIGAYPLLDGHALTGADAQQWVIQRRALRTVREMTRGDRREQLAWWGAGYPAIRTTRTFRIAYNHLGGMRDLVGGLLAVPGTHQLVLWRPEDLAWIGDGARTEFLSPWPLGVDVTAPPGGVDPTKFYPRIRTSLTAAPLTYVSQPTAAYAAGAPAAGEVWWEQGALRFKLAAAPAAGVVIYGVVYPVYTVYLGADPGISLEGPIREPRTLELLEA